MPKCVERASAPNASSSLFLGTPIVCGEVVFRGDECVSLGWCFWHRACYGCLFCGAKSVVTAPSIAELFSDDEDDGAVGEGVCAGREISEVPTCASCVVECEIDFTNERDVVQSALHTVDRTDGGLARKRWEKKNGKISRRAVGEIRRAPVAKFKADVWIQSPPLASRQHLSAQGQMHISHASHPPVDGALSGSGESGDDNGDCVVPLDSTIYVSVFDPIGRPAFKPSPTKPIPTWMQWLPSQRGCHRRNEPRPRSLLDEYFPPDPVVSIKDHASSTYTNCPTTPPQDLPYSTPSPRPSYHRHTPRCSDLSDLAESTIKAIKGPSFILDEPLMRPSSRLTHSTPTSPRSATGEAIPSHYATELLSPRSRSPYVPRRPSPLPTHAEEPDEADRDGSWRPRFQPRRSPSPLSESVAAHLQRCARRTPPAQSREFLNLYQRRANPSVAVPGRALDRQVGDARQIRSILGRHRTPPPPQVVLGTGEVVDAGSVRKRSSLQSEIMRLFGGRGREGA
ncbi:hypothetical protein F4804DRAFT_353271 [Jackrogersella minutella]|nr:hypothetical protein F4804DRAFT_353271 [Jackrogersella minutella]